MPFKPIRLDLLARDAICAAEARAANASNLEQASEIAAISTYIRQIMVLTTQAASAIEQAVINDDMTKADDNLLLALLAQSFASFAEADLANSATALHSAYEMFD